MKWPQGTNEKLCIRILLTPISRYLTADSLSYTYGTSSLHSYPLVLCLVFSLESQITLNCMSLDCERKLEHPEGTHANQEALTSLGSNSGPCCCEAGETINIIRQKLQKSWSQTDIFLSGLLYKRESQWQQTLAWWERGLVIGWLQSWNVLTV